MAPSLGVSSTLNKGQLPGLFERLIPPAGNASRLDISCNDPHLIHQLLDNLQDFPSVDLESLSVDGPREELPEFNTEHVFLPRSVSQINSHLGVVGLWDLPCGFERLTRMEMFNVAIVEVFCLFQDAPNLIECRISLDEDTFVIGGGDNFPLPTTPIIAQHLTLLATSFSTHSKFFDYLTLPSLRTLNHEYYRTISSRHDFDTLINCLERSSSPLQDFHLNINIFSSDVEDWYELLPEVTSLTLNMSEIYDRRRRQSTAPCHITENLLAALARPSGTRVFPKLSSLSLFTQDMSEASWSSLCEIFQDHTERNPTGSQEQIGETDVVQPFLRRDLLKKIEINVDEKGERHFDMEKKVFERFKELKNVGVELKVHTRHGPIFGKSASISPVINTAA